MCSSGFGVGFFSFCNTSKQLQVKVDLVWEDASWPDHQVWDQGDFFLKSRIISHAFLLSTIFFEMELHSQRSPGCFYWADNLLLQEPTAAAHPQSLSPFDFWSLWCFRLGMKSFKAPWRITCGLWSSSEPLDLIPSSELLLSILQFRVWSREAPRKVPPRVLLPDPQ